MDISWVRAINDDWRTAHLSAHELIGAVRLRAPRVWVRGLQQLSAFNGGEPRPYISCASMRGEVSRGTGQQRLYTPHCRDASSLD